MYMYLLFNQELDDKRSKPVTSVHYAPSSILEVEGPDLHEAWGQRGTISHSGPCTDQRNGTHDN